jgi:hypothetical protein
MKITFNDIFTAITALVALAAFVTSIRNARAIDRQKYYSDLDSLYVRVLELGLAHPNLIDPASTTHYQEKFTGDDLNRYNAYAFIVWNVCETIYDYCKGDEALWETWRPVIDAENTLHRTWLKNNQPKFKQSFLEYMEVL